MKDGTIETWHECKLMCWTCGKTKPIVTDGPPKFALDLLVWAKEAGWVGAMDFEHSRTLVFCCDDCRKRAIKKDGTFRLRPPRGAKQ